MMLLLFPIKCVYNKYISFFLLFFLFRFSLYIYKISNPANIFESPDFDTPPRTQNESSQSQPPNHQNIHFIHSSIYPKPMGEGYVYILQYIYMRVKDDFGRDFYTLLWTGEEHKHTKLRVFFLVGTWPTIHVNNSREINKKIYTKTWKTDIMLLWNCEKLISFLIASHRSIWVCYEVALIINDCSFQVQLHKSSKSSKSSKKE